MKRKKDASILAFMKPKPLAVPTTVLLAPLIHAISGPSHSSTTDVILSCSSSPDISHHIGGFLDRFQRIVGVLSESIPVGNSGNRLVVFRSPEHFDNPNINSEDLWEEHLNRFMKEHLG